MIKAVHTSSVAFIDGQPHEFEEIGEMLRAGGRIGAEGFIDDREAYLDLLASQDVVLSTALQEFQGLAVQEAIACGCIPVVPDSLSYQEFVPAQYRYQSAKQAVCIVSMIANKNHRREETDLSAYDWDKVGPAWLEKIQSMVS